LFYKDLKEGGKKQRKKKENKKKKTSFLGLLNRSTAKDAGNQDKRGRRDGKEGGRPPRRVRMLRDRQTKDGRRSIP